jgi:methenyltetrahydrofolate cyclohydrolase
VTSGEEPLRLRVDELIEAVASEHRGIGAGSVAALMVALAAALAAMAARLSRAGWDEEGGTIAQADALRLRVAPLAQADAEAWLAATAELRAQGASPSPERDERLGTVLGKAAAAPLMIAEAGADVAELAALTAEHCDADLRADAVGAALFAEAGTRAAARVVEVNLTIAGSDPRVAQANGYADRARSASARALTLGT